MTSPVRRVLVTGGAGFVGRHVCRALADYGREVVVLDALLRFPPTGGEAPAPASAPSPEAAALIRADLRDREAVREALGRLRPDAVVHLAALPLVGADPRLAVAVNVDGTRNLLEELGTPGTVRRFLFASSSTVYGDFRSRPVAEDHPTDPREGYGRTKLIGEQLTRLYCEAFGIPATIVRPTAVYGPGDGNRRVVQLFLEQALAGRPLTVEGDGSERLDFTYVEDLADGIALALLAEEGRGETFNLARGEERTVLELAAAIVRAVPGTRIVHRPAVCARPSRGALAIDKARRLLAYRPRFPLEVGIGRCLAALPGGRALPEAS
jgi:nucleoside-diphosphate-sugar epimerase